MILFMLLRFLPPPPRPLRTVRYFYSIQVAQAIMAYGCPSMMSLVTSPMTKQLKWPFYHGPVKCKRPPVLNIVLKELLDLVRASSR